MKREKRSRSAISARVAAFTLIELLVVVATISLLMAILLPALSNAREQGRRTACLSNLHAVGTAIHAYAQDFEDTIPFGPKAPGAFSPSVFYPSTGAPTSLISVSIPAAPPAPSVQPVALGLLLQTYLSTKPKVLFCPGSDQNENADAELAKVGIGQAQSSYFYRHGSMTSMVDTAASMKLWQSHIRINKLGINSNGNPIRALAIDTMFPSNPGLSAFGAVPRTHHQTKVANILFVDGHAEGSPNVNSRYTLDLSDYASLTQAFLRILEILERAEEAN
jgi:prepilin-type processing-associated H-X9-DG protein